MESSAQGNKLLIPTRPYDPNSIKNSTSSPIKPPVPKINSQSLINSEKIQVPNREYTAVPSQEKSQILSITPKTLAEMRKTLEEMRNSLKQKLRNTIAEIKIELKKLDDLENSLILSCPQSNISKLKINYSEFFKDVRIELTDSEFNFNSPIVVPNFISTSYDNKSESSDKKHFQEEKKLAENAPILVALGLDRSLVSQSSKKVEAFVVPDFCKGMSALKMPQNKLLVAGGPLGKNYIIDLSNSSIKKLPKLTVVKTYFSMAYIQNFPGIIGGLIPPSSVTDSVEVYNGSKWISHSHLNIGRSHSQSAKYMNATYVFGGFSGGIRIEIERFIDTWALLKVEMPDNRRNFAVVGFSNSLLLLGGEINGDKRNDVLLLDLDSGIFKPTRKLDRKFSSLTSTAAEILNKSVYLIDSKREEVFKYEIII